MNREETKQAIELMQAYVDGKEVEFADAAEDVWALKTKSIMWDFVHYEYRIKPTPREFWIDFDDGTFIISGEGNKHWGAEHELIKVREVIE